MQSSSGFTEDAEEKGDVVSIEDLIRQWKREEASAPKPPGEPDLGDLIGELRKERDADLTPDEVRMKEDKARREAAGHQKGFRERLAASRNRDRGLKKEGLPTPLERMQQDDRNKQLARQALQNGGPIPDVFVDDLAPTPLDPPTKPAQPAPEPAPFDPMKFLGDLLK